MYTSRESIAPIAVINTTNKKINVTHNGSSNRDANSSESSIVEATTLPPRVVNHPLLKLQQLQQQRSQLKQGTVAVADTNTNTNLVQSKENDKETTKQHIENEKGEKLYDEGLEEYEDEIEEYDNENDPIIDEHGAGFGGERDEAGEVIEKNDDKSENKPVILTSNFFLPAATTTPAADATKTIAEEQIENESQVVDNEKSTEIEGEIDAEDIQAKTPQQPIVENVEKSKKTVEAASNPATDIEYEYEYEYDDETTTPQIIASTTKSSVTGVATRHEIPVEEITVPATDADYETTTITSNNSSNDMIVSVVTTKSVINGSTSTNTEESVTKAAANESDTIPTASPDPNEIDANSTESYVVVASVQTSRSISGARFLPFPQVEQEEKKQSLADLEKDDADANLEMDGERSVSSSDQAEDSALYENAENDSATLTTARPEETTIATHENVSTQEMATDRISDIATSPKGHKWSSVSEKLAHLHDKIDNVEVTTKGVPVIIRKFMPRTTKMPHKSEAVVAKVEKNAPQNDEMGALLPPGFKFRPHSSYKNGKITTTTELNTPEVENSELINDELPVIEIKNRIQFKEIALADLLPKDYKSPPGGDSSDADDILAMLLPNNYKKSMQSTTKSSVRSSTVTEESVFLPPGFKSHESTSKQPSSDATIVDDISKFLPPGFKLPARSSTTPSSKPATILDDISKFLPPGFKPPTTTPSNTKSESPHIPLSDNIGKFLPPGFNSGAATSENTSNGGSKMKMNSVDISSLLPPGFNLNKLATATVPPSSPSPSFKIVFPKGIGKRPGGRVTTPRPSHAGGPTQPSITIRKGLPTRYVV